MVKFSRWSQGLLCAQITIHVIYCCALCNIPWGELKFKKTKTPTETPNQQSQKYMVQHLVMKLSEKLLDLDRDGRKDI